MKKNLTFTLCSFFLFFLNQLQGLEEKASPIQEKPFVVIIPSYNNSKWYEQNINTVINQKYKNFRVIYLNDASNDKTGYLVKQYMLKLAGPNQAFFRSISFDERFSRGITDAAKKFSNRVNSKRSFFTLIDNVSRCGALCNLYRGIYSCKDEEIIVTLDGDDWFSDDEVLKRLNETYSNGNIWLTHGTLVEYPSGQSSWCEPVPPDVIEKNAFREFKCPSHLRTFYTWLFKKINLEDLLYEGEFFSMTWDMAIMYPMIEMCGERHEFIFTPNYIYNTSNPINDNKVNADLQNFLDRFIRQSKPYQRLEK